MSKAALSGKYAAYPEYKDSGVKWLGNVPSHWIVSKFSYLKTVLTDYTANGSFADLKTNVTYLDEPSYARLVRLTDLRHDLNNSNGVWVNEASYKYLNKSALFGGEFLLANVGAYAGLFYQMPFNKGAASLAPNMFMAKFNDSKVSREFMAFVGQSDNISCQLKLSATASSAQPKLNKDDFKSVRFTYPPLKEQNQIAAFLDHETAKIDTLIEKQQQLIELLKEKRQAVISHAVTKGLNPDAPMKDSGVEWLGEVPKHWEILPTKRLFKLVAEPSEKNNNHELLSVYTAIGVAPRKELEQKGNKASSTDGYWLVQKGDIIVNKLLAWMGAVGYSNYDGVTSPAYDILRKIKDINPKFYHYLFRQEFTQQEFKRWSRGIMEMRLRLYFEELGRIFMPVPPINEQNKIVQEIEMLESKYEDIESNATKQIKLLQERRTALISAAVTGKIDLRNWVAPATSSDTNEAQQEVIA